MSGFLDKADAESIAWTGSELDNDWSRAHCFLRAADSLAAEALESPGLRGVFAAPILFLVRHSIELELKCLIAEAEELYFQILEPWGWTKAPLHTHVVDKLTKTHSLSRLVDWLRERIDAVLGQGLDPNLVSVVTELDQIDPKGEAFRYTRTRDGSPSLESELQFDLSRLRENLRALRKMFINLEVGLELERDMSADYISQCSP
jgi:hypothetical protein